MRKTGHRARFPGRPAFWARLPLALAIGWCGLAESIQLFSRVYFHTWIGGDWFLVFLASDASEMLDFAALNAGALSVCLALALGGLALAAASFWLPRRWWFVLLGCFCAYAVQGIVRWRMVWTPAYLAYDTVRSVRDYGHLVGAGRWSEDDERAARQAREDPARKDLPTLVLVIGESLTTSRMGIYGYERDTTPNLAVLATNGLEVLPPRRVTSSYTAKALEELLVRDGESVVRTLRRKGYHPVLLSAQRHWERYCGVEQMVFAACERKRYLQDEGAVGFTDLNLVGWVREALASGERPLFLIVHLLGSHFPCRARYPDYWSPEEGFDDYDMSVRVTDTVVADIIRALPANAELLFTSDHGESPNSPNWRDAADPDLWRVPLLVYPKGSRDFLCPKDANSRPPAGATPPST